MDSLRSDRHVRRLLYIDDRQVQDVVEDLDGHSSDRAASRRAQRRFRYRHIECSVRIRQPGDVEPRWFKVATRNLSSGGASIMHGGFVHPRSEIVLRLLTLPNKTVEVAGEVRSCRYVHSGVYEVCIQFTEPIHPETFCREAQERRVLFIEPDSLVAELTQRQMQALHVAVSIAASVDLAVPQLKDERYDCVLINGDASVDVLRSSFSELDRAGHFGWIAAIVSGENAERDAALTTMGCDRVVAGPLSAAVVEDAIRASADADRLRSELRQLVRMAGNVRPPQQVRPDAA